MPSVTNLVLCPETLSFFSLFFFLLLTRPVPESTLIFFLSYKSPSLLPVARIVMFAPIRNPSQTCFKFH
ncbi:hypothetical protein BDV12DRAFT_74595 [Aspergillus spectabilis]